MRVPLYFLSGVESLVLWDGASHAEDKSTVKDLGAVMWGPLTPAPDTPAEEE
jgi:hypothetical protein